jgi:hypothetical protein
MLTMTVGDATGEDCNSQRRDRRDVAKPSTSVNSTTIVDGNVTTTTLESIRELCSDGEWRCVIVKRFAFASSTTMACRRKEFLFYFYLTLHLVLATSRVFKASSASSCVSV